MRKYSEHREIVSSDRYSEKETGRVTIFSQLHCPTQVFLLWVLLQVCRWEQETELIWMAGGRCQPRRRRHTHWLRYCICIYTLCLCVFCICIYSLCLCIFVFVFILCVCVFLYLYLYYVFVYLWRNIHWIHFPELTSLAGLWSITGWSENLLEFRL